MLEQSVLVLTGESLDLLLDDAELEVSGYTATFMTYLGALIIIMRSGPVLLSLNLQDIEYLTN